MPPSVPPSRPAVPVVEHVLLAVLFLGAIAMLSLPAARGVSASFGWMPLWLLGLPAIALATSAGLRGFRRDAAQSTLARPRRRRSADTAPATPRRGAGSAARRSRRPQAA